MKKYKEENIIKAQKCTKNLQVIAEIKKNISIFGLLSIIKIIVIILNTNSISRYKKKGRDNLYQ